MRTFADDAGRCWDVAVSTASYGAQTLIFAARGGGEMRASMLELHSHFEAEQMLLRAREEELRQLLTEAYAWNPA